MNKNALINIATFAIGAAVGSVATWKLLKTKYENIAQEEIDSVKEAFAEEAKTNSEPVEDQQRYVEDEVKVAKAQTKAYNEIIKNVGYSVSSGYSEGIKDLNNEVSEKIKTIVAECDEIVNLGKEAMVNTGGKETMVKDGPYIIPPSDFGEDDEYEVITLVCYADGVITESDNGEIVDDVEGAIGDCDVRAHFGEYEDDSVFIRNEERKVDYEILRDTDNYYE